jgi:5'(3')-deoxyribonucleotidase
MKKLKIGIDMDGVITDFTLQFIRYAVKKGYKINPTTIYDDYNIERSILYKDEAEQKKIIDNFMMDDNFWLTMSPIHEAIDGVRNLNYRFDVRIITAPFKGYEEDCKEDKLLWLEKHLPEIKKISFNPEKWKEKIDVIIDDKPSTLERCKENGIITIAMDYKYNRKTNSDYRLLSWGGISGIMRKIIDKF